MTFATGCIFDSDDDEKETNNGIEFGAETYQPLKVGATSTYKSTGTERGEEFNREYTSTIVGKTIIENKTYFVMFDYDMQDSIYVRIENNILYDIFPFEEFMAKAAPKSIGILSTRKVAIKGTYPRNLIFFGM